VSESRQLAFSFEHRSALDGEDFLVTPSNREAIAWLDAWPDWPAPLLVIHGPPGSGKSHLGQVFRARTGALHLSQADLGPAAHDRPEIWIDDAEHDLAEEALLHLYSAVAARSGHILMTATTAPAAWKIALPDLRSRLLAAPAVAIGRPDDALIMAVLGKLFSDRQVRVDVDVVEYLARRMERSLTEAERLVALIDRAALAERRDVTVPFVRDLLYRDRT
jgi:chromosomal replication initiation ATPase DnaA